MGHRFSATRYICNSLFLKCENHLYTCVLLMAMTLLAVWSMTFFKLQFFPAKYIVSMKHTVLMQQTSQKPTDKGEPFITHHVAVGLHWGTPICKPMPEGRIQILLAVEVLTIKGLSGTERFRILSYVRILECLFSCALPCLLSQLAL